MVIVVVVVDDDVVLLLLVVVVVVVVEEVIAGVVVLGLVVVDELEIVVEGKIVEPEGVVDTDADGLCIPPKSVIIVAGELRDKFGFRGNEG
jgi:hypothetical protein